MENIPKSDLTSQLEKSTENLLLGGLKNSESKKIIIPFMILMSYVPFYFTY